MQWVFDLNWAGNNQLLFISQCQNGCRTVAPLVAKGLLIWATIVPLSFALSVSSRTHPDHFNFKSQCNRVKSICSINIVYLQMNYLVVCYFLVKIFQVVYYN